MGKQRENGREKGGLGSTVNVDLLGKLGMYRVVKTNPKIILK